MSGCENKGTSEKTFEKALKQVFDCHRDLIREYRAEVNDYKQKYEELLEKQTPRYSGKCHVCPQLQHSLNALQEAYKQSLEEKDKLIQYLEGRVAELTGKDTQSKSTIGKPVTVITSKKNQIVEKNQNKQKISPDSTSTSVEKDPLKVSKEDEPSSDSDSHSEKSPKLRLLKRKQKRIRYVEDETQDKKKHKRSPSAKTNTSSGSICGSTEASSLFLSVFVPDTCLPDTEVSHDSSFQEKTFQAETNISVPETMDMDSQYVESSENEEHGIAFEDCIKQIEENQSRDSLSSENIHSNDKDLVKSNNSSSENHSVPSALYNRVHLGQNGSQATNCKATSKLQHEELHSNKLVHNKFHCDISSDNHNGSHSYNHAQMTTHKTSRKSSSSTQQITQKKFTKPKASIKPSQGASSVLSVDSCDDFSDADSPLLLRSVSKLNKIQTGSDGSEECDWLSCDKQTVDTLENQNKKIVKKKNMKSNTSSRSLRSNTSLFFTEKNDDLCRNLRQTTLSQTFMSSPKTKPVDQGHSSSEQKEDDDVKEAIRLSLEEIQNKQVIESVHDELSSPKNNDATTGVENINPSFKIPLSPSKWLALHFSPKSKMKGRKADKLDDLDETLPPQSQRTTRNSKKLYMDHDEQCRINGSPDHDSHLTPDVSDHVNGNTEVDKIAQLSDDEIPCTARSYKFEPSHKKAYQINNSIDSQNLDDMDGTEDSQNQLDMESTEIENISLDDSFDRVPVTKNHEFAHVKVVRKRDEREKLQGHECKDCVEYYKAAGLSEDEMKKRMQKCSRHRAKYVPPGTPEHFWSIGFPDTPECIERGYMRSEENVKPSNFRRRRKLERKFKLKNEIESNDED